MIKIGSRTCQLGACYKIVWDVYCSLSNGQIPIHSSKTQSNVLSSVNAILTLQDRVSLPSLGYPQNLEERESGDDRH